MIVTQYGQDKYDLDLNTDHNENPDDINIISGRYRGDMQFGWECRCGNTSILAREEADNVRNLVPMGSEPAINRLVKSLKETDNKKFSCVEI